MYDIKKHNKLNPPIVVKKRYKQLAIKYRTSHYYCAEKPQCNLGNIVA